MKTKETISQSDDQLLRINDFSSRHQFSAKIGRRSKIRESGRVLIKPDLVSRRNRWI